MRFHSLLNTVRVNPLGRAILLLVHFPDGVPVVGEGLD